MVGRIDAKHLYIVSVYSAYDGSLLWEMLRSTVKHQWWCD